MPIYRVMAQKREEREKDELDKKEKEEASIELLEMRLYGPKNEGKLYWCMFKYEKVLNLAHNCNLHEPVQVQI